MTGQLYIRYTRFRALGMRPAAAHRSAAESLVMLPAGPAFAAALVELETRLSAMVNGLPLTAEEAE